METSFMYKLNKLLKGMHPNEFSNKERMFFNAIQMRQNRKYMQN